MVEIWFEKCKDLDIMYWKLENPHRGRLRVVVEGKLPVKFSEKSSQVLPLPPCNHSKSGEEGVGEPRSFGLYTHVLN